MNNLQFACLPQPTLAESIDRLVEWKWDSISCRAPHITDEWNPLALHIRSVEIGRLLD